MKKIILVLVMCALSACSLAPKYTRPEVPTPDAYKETGKWVPANPSYSVAKCCGPWWTVYSDPVLNSLEDQVTKANQNLKAALARYDEARALAEVARSALFPLITGNAGFQRVKNSANTAFAPAPLEYNDMSIGTNLSYEIDVWGKVRNAVKAADWRAKASAADWSTISLSMHAELATDYFSLRGDDEAIRILDETVQAYRKAYDLTLARFKGGASPMGDVDQAKAQLESAKTLAADRRLHRAQEEHAIAVLMGEAPGQFTLLTTRKKVKVISVGPSIPSVLLLRRPDVAAAELRVQAANAEIGVARAAYFPDFNLLGTFGIESAVGYNLFRAPSFFWSLGPTATQYIFAGGYVTAYVDLAKANYQETVANYRQTSLTAFQEVEDNLVAIHRLNREMQTEKSAVDAAYRAVTQANYRYKGGIINYLDVVTTQNIALSAALTDVDIRVRRQNSSVLLIKAIGGGW